MKCLFCKHGTTEAGKTTKLIEYNGNLIIIKNIPCMECEQCGERYYSDDVMKQLEFLTNEAKKMIQEVSIIDYSKITVA